MTTNFTQFMNVLCQAFPDFVTDIDTSTYAAQMNSQIRYNIQRRKIEEITLDDGETYSLSYPSLATGDWHVLAITCRGAIPTSGLTQSVAGQGYITTTGHKADNSTSITGITPIYGATMPSGTVFPGIVFLSSYNWTAVPTITSQLDGSIFTIYDSLCVEDGA